jgi:CDP-diacylglycerol---glycerol-3-phosphate 3-phosphatidyltransferase
MISRQIGRGFSAARAVLARGLLRLHVHPNVLTVVGMLLMVGAGVAMAAGAEYWRTWAAGLLFSAGACDLLDGAMAKMGRLQSTFGGILDSVCDRISDAALYLGPAFYFMRQPDGPNVTLVLLCFVGLVWAYLTSYIKARAEMVGAQGGGGFWQRPERIATILLGAAFLHVATAVWILGLCPILTVVHRLWRAWRTSARPMTGGESLEPAGLSGLILWRWPRGGIPFDIHAGLVIVTVAIWDIPLIDPLRDLAAWWVGA